MSRNFAPADERLKSVIAREQKMPANFAAAKSNLKDVPKIYTEIALRAIAGHHQLLPERCAAGLQKRHRPEAAGRLQGLQR